MESTKHHLVAANDVANGSIVSRVLASAQLLSSSLLDGRPWIQK